MVLDPKLVAAQWYAGELYGGDMPGIACRALEEGHDGPNLRQLAGLDNPARRNVTKLVEGALRELGVRAPIAKRDAALCMAGHVAREIIEGKVEPYRGACRIWLTYSFGVCELHHWSDLAVNYEAATNADQTKLADQQIIESAKSLCLELLDAFEKNVADDG
jgi:hypothetical protein